MIRASAVPPTPTACRRSISGSWAPMEGCWMSSGASRKPLIIGYGSTLRGDDGGWSARRPQAGCRGLGRDRRSAAHTRAGGTDLAGRAGFYLSTLMRTSPRARSAPPCCRARADGAACTTTRRRNRCWRRPTRLTAGRPRRTWWGSAWRRSNSANTSPPSAERGAEEALLTIRAVS